MWHSNETWNSKWNFKSQSYELYVHREINETTEMTFKIETKLDTWHINSKFKKKFWKKNFLKKNFWKKKKKFLKIFFSKKNFQKKKKKKIKKF